MAGSSEAVVEHVAELLRARGGRMTGPRRAVLTALAEADDHITAEELVTRVQQGSAEVHRSSVYRTLEALTASGVVRHVHVNQGGTAYHLADKTARHLHAQCHVCGQVVDLPADLLQSAEDELARTVGFQLDAEHVALSGTCRSCSQS